MCPKVLDTELKSRVLLEMLQRPEGSWGYEIAKILYPRERGKSLQSFTGPISEILKDMEREGIIKGRKEQSSGKRTREVYVVNNFGIANKILEDHPKRDSFTDEEKKQIAEVIRVLNNAIFNLSDEQQKTVSELDKKYHILCTTIKKPTLKSIMEFYKTIIGTGALFLFNSPGLRKDIKKKKARGIELVYVEMGKMPIDLLRRIANHD